MKKENKWTKETLGNAIKSSVSFAEALRKLGLKPLGANYSTIKKYIKEWNIDISHILGQAHLLGKKRVNVNFHPIPIEKVLVENCPYSRKSLKKRLQENNVLQNKCSICGIGPEWNNKKLVLILDHINGVNNDNRIENLRLVCPNCNSQLSTFCGRKNKGNGKKYVCKECGKSIYKGSDRCQFCSFIHKRKVERPSYEQLMEDIKNMPITKIGEKYGVSDNTIRKWKKRYESNSSLSTTNLVL